MALIQGDEGDYLGSQETYLESLKYADVNDGRFRPYVASIYTGLSRTTNDLKNYPKTIEYADKALALVDSAYRTTPLNNKAVALQYLGRYDEALIIFDSSLRTSKNDWQRYARALSNYARTKWLRDPTYAAAAELHEARKIREEEKDNWGLNASYSHLSDYYSNTRPDSALFYAKKYLDVARLVESEEDELLALQKVVRFEQPKAAKKYFSRYYDLNDSFQTARNAAKNQFALIRYEAEKSKAENAVLQKDVTEKRAQITTQWILVGVIVALFAAAAAIGVSIYNKRKRRMQWEKERALREQELNTSQKVHDVVANGLYTIMSGLEHREAIDKENLLDEIDTLYEKSRNISYEVRPGNFHDFYNTIAGLLFSFGGAKAKVVGVGNSEEVWTGASELVKENVAVILQELLINMKKHSEASNVMLKFEKQENNIILHYADDGIGFPPAVKYGNGLTNTENRITKLGGNIKFEPAAKGTKVKITIPIA